MLLFPSEGRLWVLSETQQWGTQWKDNSSCGSSHNCNRRCCCTDRTFHFSGENVAEICTAASDLSGRSVLKLLWKLFIYFPSFTAVLCTDGWPYFYPHFPSPDARSPSDYESVNYGPMDGELCFLRLLPLFVAWAALLSTLLTKWFTFFSQFLRCKQIIYMNHASRNTFVSKFYF